MSRPQDHRKAEKIRAMKNIKDHIRNWTVDIQACRKHSFKRLIFVDRHMFELSVRFRFLNISFNREKWTPQLDFGERRRRKNAFWAAEDERLALFCFSSWNWSRASSAKYVGYFLRYASFVETLNCDPLLGISLHSAVWVVVIQRALIQDCRFHFDTSATCSSHTELALYFVLLEELYV